LLLAGMRTIDGGLFEGPGVVDNDLINGGTVKPGDSPGTLTVNGTYDQTGAGMLEIELAGLSFYDVPYVNGAADLSGELNLQAINGFVLSAGDSFFILDYDSRNGAFDKIDTSGLDLLPGFTAEVPYDQGAGNEQANCAAAQPTPIYSLNRPKPAGPSPKARPAAFAAAPMRSSRLP
jgi:hypothetical protein